MYSFTLTLNRDRKVETGVFREIEPAFPLPDLMGPKALAA
jgi:hypothetical protein